MQEDETSNICDQVVKGQSDDGAEIRFRFKKFMTNSRQYSRAYDSSSQDKDQGSTLNRRGNVNAGEDLSPIETNYCAVIICILCAKRLNNDKPEYRVYSIFKRLTLL